MLLEITLVQDGLSALFAAFLSGAAVFLNQLITHLKNKEPKKNAQLALADLQKKVNSIQGELTTNGGTTVKDHLIKTSKAVEVLGNHFNDLKKDLNNLKAESRSRTEILMNNSLDALFICNERGECVFANEATKLLYGMSDLSGYRGLIAITDQKTRQYIKASWDAAVAEKMAYRETFEIMNQISRTKYNVTVTVNPVLDEKNNFLFFTGKIKTNDKITT